ncbi:MAG: IclR family transcriptional regulator, partial [Oscillospiraceae bacterium]
MKYDADAEKLPRDEKSTRSNQSSEKMLTLLERLSEQDEPIRLQDISRLVQMNESTALRYIATLQKSGYVVQDEDTGRYSLTYKICAVAANVSSHKSIRNICTPYLRSIAHIFSESANVAEEHDMAVVYIEAVNGPRQLLMTTRRIGNVSPMHCTAVGKLLLLNYTPQQIDHLIATKGMPAMTQYTIVTRERLLAELEKVRQQGYAFDNEEYEQGARCVAAPIYDFTGQVIAGLSVSGPVTRMTDERLYEKLPFLIDAAQQISMRMG